MNFIKTVFLISLSTLLYFSANLHAGEEKPIKHMEKANITDAAKAKEVFLADTKKLMAQGELNEKALHQIHFITYSLEKSVAFYAEQGKEEIQTIAQEMAAVVEEVHLNSENNRTEETRKSLDQYFAMAKKLEAQL